MEGREGGERRKESWLVAVDAEGMPVRGSCSGAFPSFAAGVSLLLYILPKRNVRFRLPSYVLPSSILHVRSPIPPPIFFLPSTGSLPSGSLLTGFPIYLSNRRKPRMVTNLN